MSQDDHPFYYLPVAVPGLVIGGLLTFVAGSLFLHEWSSEDGSSPTASMVTVEGPIRAAHWVGSASADGPRGYLRIEIEGAPKPFIVAAASVPASYDDTLDKPEPLRQAPRRPVPFLQGRMATIVTDSSLAAANQLTLPYMSGLTVEGEVIVSGPATANGTQAAGWSGTLLVLFGGGTVIGFCIFALSLHHILICIRFWYRPSQ